MKKPIIKRKRKRKNPDDDFSFNRSDFVDYIDTSLANISRNLKGASLDTLVKVTRKLEEIQDELGMIGLRTPEKRKVRSWDPKKDPERWL